MSGKPESREDWRVYLLADILTRLLYAIVSIGAVLLVVIRYFLLDEFLSSPWFWLLLLAVGILGAAVGPYLYRYEAHRGRGSLKEVRSKSKRRR